MATIRRLNPGTIEKPPGYTHVIEVAGPSRTVYFAGQLGVDINGKFVEGGFRAQCEQAHENLRLALAEIGGTFADLVKINNFLVDIEANMLAYRETREKFFGSSVRPASTTIGIPALARPGGLFEVEAIAVMKG